MKRTIFTRVVTFTTGVAIGLNLITGAAFAAPLTTTDAGLVDVVTTETPASAGTSDAKFECSDSHHSDTGHGANNSEGYQDTCLEEDFGGNGQEFGPGLDLGKPCAGCVGNADDKNPPGQYPDGSDLNSGYECDGRDRPFVKQEGNGNHGVGDENPAHTGCVSMASVPLTCPDGPAMPATDRDGNGVINAADCKPAGVDPNTGFTAPPSAETTVAAVFRCTAVDVSSSRYDLSNVVLRFADGTDQRFEGLEGRAATFSGTDAFTGKVVESVFIKAGNNASGEGPGYGERIDATTDTCGGTASDPVTCPDGSAMPATDQDGNGVINAADCTPAVVVPVTCPDGSAMPATDQDGNGVINAADCTPAVVAADEDVVVPTVTTEPEVTPAVSTTRPVLASPVVVLASVQPSTLAEIPTEVLGATFDRTVVPEVAVPETAVLGTQFNRSAPALAATGAGGVSNTATLALILVALGFALVLWGRRPQAD